MATAAPKPDLAAFQEKIASQFRGLNPNDPASWPMVPKAALCLAVTVAILAALWFLWLTSSADELAAEQQKEVVLRTDYTKKLKQAVKQNRPSTTTAASSMEQWRRTGQYT